MLPSCYSNDILYYQIVCQSQFISCYESSYHFYSKHVSLVLTVFIPSCGIQPSNETLEGKLLQFTVQLLIQVGFSKPLDCVRCGSFPICLRLPVFDSDGVSARQEHDRFLKQHVFFSVIIVGRCTDV
jgi:hypothetical protein